MIGDLNVPAGQLLHLLAHEIRPNPTHRDELVRAVAVYRAEIGGMVWMRGHVCGGDVVPDCAAGWCFEAQVSVDAIRANLAGAR
ncbi:hypothetical protein [Micromonospora sp. NPDC050695]|uniref:hypothetical protein n=1 Tax=Micromonospora sp. NPDC050695 TaxID=3154938 RepID=UPI0033C444F7